LGVNIPFEIVDFFYQLSLVVWLGGIIILSFIVAPTVFGSLPRPQAGPLQAKIFRRFHLWQFVFMLVLLASSMTRYHFWENPENPDTLVVVRQIMIFLMVILGVFQLNVISKRMRVLREEITSWEGDGKDDPKRQAFGRWHKISVRIVLVVLILGLAVLFLS